MTSPDPVAEAERIVDADRPAQRWMAGVGARPAPRRRSDRRDALPDPRWRETVTKRCQIEQLAHAVFPTTFDELVGVTGGEPADVA